jgi:ketosteroid isomerase-like protein
MELKKRLMAIYAAFNARDIDAVLEHMTADVDWPNAWEGGRVHGHEGVRDYWTRQWSTIDPIVEPLSVLTRPDGSVAVEVHQAGRTLDGELLGQARVLHIYVFRDGLIAAMDVEEFPDSA